MFYVMLALRAELRRRGAFADAPRAQPRASCSTSSRSAPSPTSCGWTPTTASSSRRASSASAPGTRLAGRRRAARGRGPRRAQRDASTTSASSAGPRLNAAGRLDDMSLGIECLIAATRRAPRALAGAARRAQPRAPRDRGRDAGLGADDGSTRFEADDGYTLAIHDPEWHAGVVGILASRLKDRFHRPVFAFALRQRAASSRARGARSRACTCATRSISSTSAHPGMLERFGGHAAAAGATLAGRPARRVPRGVRGGRARAAHARGPPAAHRDRRRAGRCAT